MNYEVALSELDAFARTFWQVAGDTRVFAFHGQMGAGKTTLISALCRARGVADALSSPTFSIINEYQDGSGAPIFHMDLYRLNDPEEVLRTGVEDTISSGDICLVEWPERAPQLFDAQTLHVHLSVAGADKRAVVLSKGAAPVQ